VQRDGWSQCSTEGNTRNRRKSLQKLGQQFGVSTSTAWKICCDDLLLFPYKMQLSWQVSEDGIARYFAFARENGALLDDSLGVLNVM
jgi:hypothetical protein